MKVKEFLKSIRAQILVSVILLGVLFWKLPGITAGLKAKTGEDIQPKATPVASVEEGTWRFIVSGDSRNCGDVVMPAIAAHSSRYSPSFYWHLGDLRAIYKIDEDMAAAWVKKGQYLTCDNYLRQAWPDFIDKQIGPFGGTRFYLGIGNHETIPPKDQSKFTAQFGEWLLSPALENQRIQDGEKSPLIPRAYYHWIEGGVDLIYLDNALNATFSSDQLKWFDATLNTAKSNPAVRSIVVGMHESLPDSSSPRHAMCDAPQDPHNVESCNSGRHVYDALLAFQHHKPVYVLASHSHFYMEGLFNNQAPDKQLPGWIVGTAGAVRYKLPDKPPATAKTDVYGYLLATVREDGKKINFEFQQVDQPDVPRHVWAQYPPDLVPWCFAHNSLNKEPSAPETTQKCTPPAAPATKPSAGSSP